MFYHRHVVGKAGLNMGGRSEDSSIGCERLKNKKYGDEFRKMLWEDWTVKN